MQNAGLRPIQDDLSLVLCGAAGQGIQTIEQVLTQVLKRAGYHIFAVKEVMSRIRGGCNSTEIRISNRPVRAFLERIDVLVPLSAEAVAHLGGRVTERTVVIGSRRAAGAALNLHEVDFEGMGKALGNTLYANAVAIGVVCGIVGVDVSVVEGLLAERFASKGKAVVAGNVAAAKAGYGKGRQLAEAGVATADLQPDASVREALLIDGAAALGCGALAGGCNFVSSYPMSPSTGVLVFFAQHARDLGTVVEQAEDEIAAVNMCLGAWYAGGRALVTTSGGGFALMTEGLSLAGMVESPLVVHVAQRPGPATGLPTRTEQGDLDLVVHAGHGEFPRLVLAPRSLEDAFDLTRRAFDLADRFQVPVIILTDQFLMDSLANVGDLALQDGGIKHHFVPTGADYQRYRFGGTPLSPRGIPGYGTGLVCLDSDEHDEAGHITEDLALRVKMVDKRRRKLDDLPDEPWCCKRIGSPDADWLAVCWGSTGAALAEALALPGLESIAGLLVQQVYPVPETVRVAVTGARRVVVLEGNAGGQFANLIRRTTGVAPERRILKYNGLPFSVEEVAAGLKELPS